MSNKIQLVIDAVNRADSKIDSVEKKIGDLEKRTKRAQANMKSFATGVGAATGVIVALGLAAKKSFEFAREGAMLDRTRVKFDRLAGTIGVTGDVLEKKLVSAMGGIASKMEAVTLGTDLLSLGLVKSQDEALRMARAVGQLGMDMNQLVLTLTNQTTMRFDSLGVSVDGFKEKVNDLKRAGMDADAAFRLAFIEQAEEQIEKVGDVADTTAGAFLALEARVKDYTDAMKLSASEGLAPYVEAITIAWDWKIKMNEAMANGALTVEFAKEMEDAITIGTLSHYDALVLLTGLVDSYTEALIKNNPELAYHVGLQEAAARAAGATIPDSGVATSLIYQLSTGTGAGADIAGSGASLAAQAASYGATAGSITYGGQRYSNSYWSGNKLMRDGKIILTKQARGGRLAPVSLVGEEGPELIIGNQVIPAGPTRRLLAGGVRPGQKLAGGGYLGGIDFVPDWASEGNPYNIPSLSKTPGGAFPSPSTTYWNELYGSKGLSAPFSGGAGESLPAGTLPAAGSSYTPPPVSIAETAATTESTAASVGVKMAQTIVSELGKDADVSNRLQGEMLSELRKIPKKADLVQAFKTALDQVAL